MASAGEPIAIGPFNAGMNLAGDAAVIADNELADLVNMEVAIDGSLKERPAMEVPYATLPGGSNGRMLGWYNTGTNLYLIAANNNNTYRIRPGIDGSWTLITGAPAATASLQFEGLLWLVADPDSGQNSGSWDGTTWTGDTSMPRGSHIAAYKGVLYIGTNRSGTPSISTKSRLYRSNPLGTTPRWPASQLFIDIGYGDGEDIIAMTVWQGSIIIFRTNSIWTYNWATSPAGANPQPLDSTVGLDNRWSWDAYNGVLYFMYSGRAYALTSGRVEVLNETVPFSGSQFVTVGATTYISDQGLNSVTTFGSRILFNYLNWIYVYGTETNTWSRWQRNSPGGTYLQHMGKGIPSPGAGTATIYGFGRLTGQTAAFMRMIDQPAILGTDVFLCSLRTKTFDFESPYTYKRLFWWGVEAGISNTIVGAVTPIAGLQTGTGTSIQTAVTTTRNGVGTATPERVFVKMNQSLRFRQCYFEVTFQGTGYNSGDPIEKKVGRVYGLTAFVRTGERASKSTT